ncbi:MAG: sterol desaturase family protein [Actinomycetota bacterium]
MRLLRRPLVSRLLLLALIAASIAIERGVVLVVPLVFVLIVPLEKLFPRHLGQRVRRPELGTDVAYALIGPVLNVASIVVGATLGALTLAWVPGLAMRPLVSMIPDGLRIVVAFLLFDLLIYWTHRFAHEVPALWRFHAVHHTPKTLDWVSGFRNHPLDGLIIAPPVFFLIAAGFDPVITGALAVIQGIVGLLLHANVRWRLRPLHRVVATPEFHHWHHADEADAINSNYAAFLPIWDVIFGSYYMPRRHRPMSYGISQPMPTDVVGLLSEPMTGLRPGRWALDVVRYPIRSTWRLRRWTAGLLSEMARSARRPRRRQIPAGDPLPWTAARPEPGAAEATVASAARASS